jgi:hypothetical protein
MSDTERLGVRRGDEESLRYRMVMKKGAYVIEVCRPDGTRLPDMDLDAFLEMMAERSLARGQWEPD